MNYSSILSNIFPNLIYAIIFLGSLYAIIQTIDNFIEYRRGNHLNDNTLKILDELSQYCHEISGSIIYPEDQPKKDEIKIIDDQKAKVILRIGSIMRPYVIEFALESALKDIQKGEDNHTYKRIKERTLWFSNDQTIRNLGG